MDDILSRFSINCHSSIRYAGGATVWFDPFRVADAPCDADVVFVTHDHYDHFSPEDIHRVMKPGAVLVLPETCVAAALQAGFASAQLLPVWPGEAYTVKDLPFTAVPAYNLGKPFHPRGNRWVGYVVTLEDSSLIKQTVEEIKKIDGVGDVNAHYEIANGFQTVQKVLNIAAMVIIVVLFVVSMFIISNTIKLAMYSRSQEIAIMKMVGATNSFIRLPFVVEGLILGFISSLVAFFLEWGLYDFLASKIAQIDTLQLITVVPFAECIEIVAIAYAITGFVVGVFGSMLSIRKFLRV